MSKDFDFKTTAEIKVDAGIINQVIGQDRPVEIIKKAAKQRRNVLLVGSPGTGKSMLGQALAELLPKEKLVDLISIPNDKDADRPLIHSISAGSGKKLRLKEQLKSVGSGKDRTIYLLIGMLVVVNLVSFVFDFLSKGESEVLQAANRISSTITALALLVIFMIYLASYQLRKQKINVLAPKVIVDNSEKDTAPFIDATGSHEGALLGDVKHDPFQSGGLGTPPHELVMAGAIHKANLGVLFIDEIATLSKQMQIELLTAMQEKKMTITGRSERSSGAMVQTEPAPCDFILVAAGNVESIQKMNIALRSRIRGYGYEVFMNDKMPDTPENRMKIAIFVAQEVVKDKKIPHFSYNAVLEIVDEAKRRAGRKGYLTLKLRELGGLIRVAGDIAKENKHEFVEKSDIISAKTYASSLEKQITEKFTEEKKEYQILRNTGAEVGRVNGLAVIGGGETFSGLVMPIEAVVAPSLGAKESKIIATGQLGKIAKEAVQNVSAIIKQYSSKNIENYDIHIQFLQTYEGVEGDSASISIATAIISSLENLPVKQDTAMTGSLSISGEVMPVGGVNEKVEAAILAGYKNIILPAMNEKDLVLPKELLRKVKIIPVKTISEVVKNALMNSSSVSRKISKVVK